MNERKLAARTLNQLAINTGLVGNIKEHELSLDSEGKSNALIMFEQSGAKLIAELRPWATESESRAIIRELQTSNLEHERVLICDYVNEELGHRLREAKVNYLDKAGNAFLQLPSVYVSIQGKAPTNKTSNGKPLRIFTEPGLKIIFALLTNSDLLNSSYRKIADCANVTMGAIGWALNELKEEAYIAQESRFYRWVDRQRLLKKWVEEYPTLRKKSHLGAYYTQDEGWWRNLELEKYQAVLGGEIAAHKYCSTPIKEITAIYVGKNKQASLVRDLQLVQADEIGAGLKPNVEILSKFWGETENNTSFHDITHPLLTHADLMDTWNPRSRKMAKQIAELFLSE